MMDSIINYGSVLVMFAICIICGYQAAQNRPEYCFLGKWGRAILIVNCVCMAAICAFVLAWGLSEILLR